MEYSKHLSNFHEQQYELQYVRVRAKYNTSAISDAIKRNRKRVQNKAFLIKFMELLPMTKLKIRNVKTMPIYLVNLSMIR